MSHCTGTFRRPSPILNLRSASRPPHHQDHNYACHDVILHCYLSCTESLRIPQTLTRASAVMVCLSVICCPLPWLSSVGCLVCNNVQESVVHASQSGHVNKQFCRLLFLALAVLLLLLCCCCISSCFVPCVLHRCVAFTYMTVSMLLVRTFQV